MSSLSQERRDLTSDAEQNAVKTRKRFKKKRSRTEKRDKSLRALANVNAKKRKDKIIVKQHAVQITRQSSTSSEEILPKRKRKIKRKLRKRSQTNDADRTPDLDIEGERVRSDSLFFDTHIISRRNSEPSPRPPTSAQSRGRASSVWSGFQSDSSKNSIRPVETRASSAVSGERSNSCLTIIEHSRPSSYEKSRPSTKNSDELGRNLPSNASSAIKKVTKVNVPPSKLRVIGPLKLEPVVEGKKKPLPPIKLSPRKKQKSRIPVAITRVDSRGRV